MPTNRTKRTRQRIQPGDIPTGHLEVHLTGHTFFNQDFATDAERQASYLKNRKYLLSLIGANVAETMPDAFLPGGITIPWGCRPHDYWRFEPLPEPRRVVRRWFGFGARGHAYYEDGETCTGSCMGKPSVCYHYEPQDVYLRRNGLLLPGEESKIDPALIPQNESAPEHAYLGAVTDAEKKIACGAN